MSKFTTKLFQRLELGCGAFVHLSQQRLTSYVFLSVPAHGDTYRYQYSEENYERSQPTTYEEAFSLGQEALRSSQASMLSRERRYPRNYELEGYAPDSTDSTDAGMNVYAVSRVNCLVCPAAVCVYLVAALHCATADTVCVRARSFG